MSTLNSSTTTCIYKTMLLVDDCCLFFIFRVKNKVDGRGIKADRPGSRQPPLEKFTFEMLT